MESAAYSLQEALGVANLDSNEVNTETLQGSGADPRVCSSGWSRPKHHFDMRHGRIDNPYGLSFYEHGEMIPELKGGYTMQPSEKAFGSH